MGDKFVSYAYFLTVVKPCGTKPSRCGTGSSLEMAAMLGKLGVHRRKAFECVR